MIHPLDKISCLTDSTNLCSQVAGPTSIIAGRDWVHWGSPALLGFMQIAEFSISTSSERDKEGERVSEIGALAPDP